MSTTTTKLTRDLDEAMLGGVMSGAAKIYGWDPTLLRIVAVLVALATGVVPGVLIYLAAWVLIPRSDRLTDSAASTSPPAAAAEGEPVSEEPAASASAQQPVGNEMADALRDAADRLGEAASIAAEAARQAANDIGEVARRPRAAGSERPEDPDGGSTDAPPSTESEDAAESETPA